MVTALRFEDYFEEDSLGFEDEGEGYDVPFSEYDAKRKSCAFTGHRKIPFETKPKLINKLKSTILYLVSLGVTEFHCGAATGFDTLAASVVYDISREHKDVRLILDIPYSNQAERWGDDDKRYYEFIKSKAHEINVHGNNPKNKEEAVKLLLSRNRVMIDKSHYCICYLENPDAKRGGTAYTVNYAKLHDRHIINLAQQE